MLVFMDTTWNIEGIRSQYPALQEGTAYLDGAGGTQVPECVIEAISDAYRSGLSNVHGPFAASRRSGQLIADAREAVADLTGGPAGGVVLGPNMTTLTYRMAAALAKTWLPGDEIVLSELDHDSNVRPWAQAAASAGVTVRWARVDPLTSDLPADQYAELVTSRTRLVAVAAASNLIGTMTDVAAIRATTHALGALVYVDAVAAGRRLHGHLRVQVVRPPRRSRCCLRCPTRDASPRQARAIDERGARTVRAWHRGSGQHGGHNGGCGSPGR